VPVIKNKTVIPNGCGMNGSQHTEPYRVACQGLART